MYHNVYNSVSVHRLNILYKKLNTLFQDYSLFQLHRKLCNYCCNNVNHRLHVWLQFAVNTDTV